ncbi:NUDIX domain-containing protein [Streptomyces sp. NPDC058695]|uniref:NUDIX domain-containing protein n=1 Tax=Streptomyces sp. NPDC058695 TaxID=3346604 RepID=UPI0036544432
MCYLRGGKPDADEEPMEALTRELDDELGVPPLEPRFLTDIEALAVLEGAPMKMTVFEARISRTPQPAAELADLKWVHGAGDGTFGRAPMRSEALDRPRE